MLAELRELWRFRELLYILVQRDLKIRYKNSILGFGWSLINPLVQVVIIAVVMKFFLHVQVRNYHAYLFCALLPWLFFQGTLMDTSISLIESDTLLRRIYFPREVLPLARVVANLIHFLLATGVFLVYIALMPLGWWAVTGRLDWALQPGFLLLPLLMVIEVFLVAGLSMVISVATLYYEDARHLLDNALKAFYWLVPVLYFADMLKDAHRLGLPSAWLYRLYMANPLATVVAVFRKLTLPPFQKDLAHGQPLHMTAMTGEDWALVGLAALTSLLIAIGGYAFFNARKWKLAERP